MTEAERDVLASVYLDGEASPEEVALVERDPDLLARVETFRTVRDTVAIRASSSGPPQGLKDRQLSAALELFDSQPVATPEPTPPESGAAEGVIDLTSRRRDREATKPGRQAERFSMLAAAAGAMVLLVGGVFLAAQVGGGDDSDSVAMELTADSAEDAEFIEPAAEETAEETAEAMADEALTEEMEEEEAVDSEAALSTGAVDESTASTIATEQFVGDAEEEFAEEDRDEALSTAGTTTTLPDIRRESVPDEGFFPQDPVVIYPLQPSGQDLVDDLTLVWRDPDSSMCRGLYQHPENALLIAYLPVEITNGPNGLPQVQEALYFTFNNDVEVVLVVRDTCQPT